MIVRAFLAGSVLAMSFVSVRNADAMGDALSYMSPTTSAKPRAWAAYEQPRESDNPYDPKFRQDAGTATVESLIPLQNAAKDAPAKENPRNL